jgi:hypothetical protein
MPMNLDSAQRVLEREMVDAVTIVRPGRDADAGTFDNGTGTYTASAADTTIYSGKAMVTTYAAEPRSRTEGGGEIKENTYTVRLPLDAAQVAENDVVTVTASLRDDQLPGKELLIVSVNYTTFAVSRKILAELRVLKRDP